MSSLTLVRHAQASFFADHYDQLSMLGERQAECLGQYWVARQFTIDAAYVGTRKRHQQTAAAVAAIYRQSGLAFPDPIALDDLDEYDLAGILHRLAPELARTNQEFAGLFERQRHGATQRDQARNFQRMFEPLMLHWLLSQKDCEGVESWPAFQARVQRALQQMTDQAGKSQRVVAFTSGGFIGTAVQLVLGAPDRTALEINWRIRNAALTEFVFSRSRITLDGFNSITHFADPELVTYR